MLAALSLSLVYIPILRVPDGPKSAPFGPKLIWSIYAGMYIMAKLIGCLWALRSTVYSIYFVFPYSSSIIIWMYAVMLYW